ncbi:Protein of unknown function [Modicisalibacter ilicicola DSM 19980]|uniref:DUF3080 domain-containing protein n=1 Tax=Modicisalibacter ilicicola DSM 19980 TaxID=1121942 RepID=A0A1M4WY52_9GAMM|nr:DUF3080 domain-containing protein [Halomonas ilicicola]SHE85892.1 Protein of unknown function [Halomonas ilicicola DSM 19980]
MAGCTFPRVDRGPLRWLLFGIAILATGCERRDGADGLFVDYQQRLGNALEVDAPSPRTPDNIAAFPPRDERLFDIAETRQSMLDVYALRECGITSLVARRNNQLGKVAAPSQHWLYELELWRKLRQCWDTAAVTRLDEEDRQRLHDLTRSKTEQLPRASWNALFDSSEWVASFSRASEALAPDDPVPLTESIAAVDYLRQVTLNQFNPAWSPESSRLEAHLYTLQTRPFSAEILRSLMLARQRLVETTGLLEARLAERPICYKGHSNPAADRLYDIFIATFIGEVQPYLATLSRTSRLWLEAINALLDAHQVAKPAVRRYRQAWLSLHDRDAPWQQFHLALQEHIASWQDVWRSCGLMPGAKDGSGA